MSHKSIKFESPAGRVILLAAVLICLAGAFFFAKWCFANTIALQAAYSAERAAPKDIAEFAVSLAPSDPETHFILGALNEKIFLPEALEKALTEYEKATALSPHDFRLWLVLGKARERSGDAAGAESALRKAIELAPNYSEVRWAFGNVLLRQGKTDEAFAEIRRAVAGDSKYTSQAVATASDMFDGELARIRQNLGESAHVNAALAAYLGRQKRFDEALQVWNALPENEKKTTFKQAGEELYKEMLAAKKYRAALEIRKQAGEATAHEIGKFTNGGFEAELKSSNQNIFDWQMAEGLQPQIGPNNAEKHSGNLSLVIVFNSPDGKDFRTVSQTIAVQSGRKYEFEVFYKSMLKASATLKWEIADASDGKVLASTGAISGNSDWTNLKVDFTTTENTEAVVIRLARDGCKSPICPISGSVWFDDFQIGEK